MNATAPNGKYDVALVMPVYNEEECIVDVVGAWRKMFEATVPNFKMIVINDGSRDGTAAKLAQFAGDPHIEAVNKPNSGHGPTILMGYRKAVGEARWVFQTDSDNELPPDGFPKLWAQTGNYDFLFASRSGREQNIGRKLISAVSRLTVRLLFKGGVRDVNTPYRLMRSEALAGIIEKIPDDTFAPNVIISGLCAKQGYRIYNTEVPHSNRRTGTVSIVKWKLWKAAMKAFFQTISIAFKN